MQSYSSCRRTQLPRAPNRCPTWSGPVGRMPEKTRSRGAGIAACYRCRVGLPEALPTLTGVGTLDQAGPAAAVDRRPRFLWRVLSPIGAVLLAFVLLVIG